MKGESKASGVHMYTHILKNISKYSNISWNLSYLYFLKGESEASGGVHGLQEATAGHSEQDHRV